MAQLPLVSVVVPTYERPAYLRIALASALGQAHTNLEVLVGDNSRADECRRIVEEFGDSRVRYIRHPENLGPTRNALTLFRQVQGKYFASLHDDDFWRADFLEKLVPPLEQHPEVAIAFSDYAVVDAQGAMDAAETRRRSRASRRDVLPAGVHRPAQEIGVIWRSLSTVTASVIRRDGICWDDFRLGLGSAYDLWLAHMVLGGGAGVYYHPERLGFYRIHPGSHTASAPVSCAQKAITCLVALLAEPRLSRHARALRRQLGSAWTVLGICLLLEGRAPEARQALGKALVIHPQARALATLPLSLLPSCAAGGLARAIRRLHRRLRR